MSLANEKLTLEYLLASKDLYARCANIIKPEYFNPELRPAVTYLEDYYQKYAALPKLDRFKAQFDIDFEPKVVGKDDLSSISDDLEIFCKRSAIAHAIKATIKDINDDNFDRVTQTILDAVNITLDRDLGIDLYVDTEVNLLAASIAIELIPCGIKVLDEKLGGGFARKELTLFSANSGVGKSVLMSNIGDNYAAMGYRVVYISLELSKEKIYSRLASIATGNDTKTWKQNIPKISAKIADLASNGGSYIVKRLPMGSTANDIRSFLQQYRLEYGCDPDVLLVDYQDIMNPIGGIGTLSISEQDKAKSEQLYEIGVDHNCIMFTASQQNRDGIKLTTPDQSVIAGGFSKINVVDNYISLFMTPAMRLEGIMLLYYLKTRSSSAVGENTPLKFNRENLQITDMNDESKARAMIKRLAENAVQSASHGKYPQKKAKEDVGKPKPSNYEVINHDIVGMPHDVPENYETGPEEIEDSPEDLLALLSAIHQP